nr:hypothetical protein GCM10020063_042300 [Dactylosporangium thailandense]
MTDVTQRPLMVVTGASSGIGHGLARQFAQHDFDLLIAAEDDSIEQATQELRRDARPRCRPSRLS